MTRNGDLSYSSGFARNMEWLVGAWFVVFGGFAVVEAVFLHPAIRVAHEPAPPSSLPLLLFPVAGLVMIYISFVWRTVRLEITNSTLYWFGAFRRPKGEIPIADIVSIGTALGIRWRLTITVIELSNGRTVRISDRDGIAALVDALVYLNPGIDTRRWSAGNRWVPRSTVYLNEHNDNGRGVIDHR